MSTEVKGVVENELSRDNTSMQHLRNAIDNQLKALDSEIERQNEQKQDYEQLRKRIEELPRKLTRRILVPFGRVGFMKGRIVHTNQVTVSLGDNYFAVQSCYEASQMMARRITQIQLIIDDCTRQKQMLLSQAQFGDQLFAATGDEVEIREPYDEDKERQLKLKRSERRRMAASSKPIPEGRSEVSMAEEGSSVEQLEQGSECDQDSLQVPEQSNKGDAQLPDSLSTVDKQEFAALMAKLDEMEREEEERNELSSSDTESALDSDDIPEGEEETEAASRHVQATPGPSAAMPQTEMDRVSPPGPQATTTKHTSKRTHHSVHFSAQLESSGHTPTTDQQSVPHDEPKTITNDEPRFSCALPRRSILRNSAERSPIDAEAVAEVDRRDQRLIMPSSQQAFTGVVCERLSPDVASTSTGPAEQSSNSQLNAEPPSKRVSRFKMYRAHIDRPNR